VAPEGVNDDAALLAAIAERVADVDTRVAVSGRHYEEERALARRAAEAMPAVAANLRLGGFVRMLGPRSGKPQLVAEFASGGGRVVLKVYGERGHVEGPLQAAWVSAGVRTIPVIDHGDTPTSWLLLPAMDLSPLPPLASSAPLARETTVELARLMAAAHRAPLPSLRSVARLDVAIPPHLRAVAAALRRHGYDVPRSLVDRAVAALGGGGRTTLHGDLGASNVGRRDADGGLLVYDARGYAGDPAFDAARWCARIGDVGLAEECLDAWLAAPGGVDRALARRLLGAELLMEAGVRELVKEEHGTFECGPDGVTGALLAAAARLMG
jgi:hypothetical protein